MKILLFIGVLQCLALWRAFRQRKTEHQVRKRYVKGLILLLPLRRRVALNVWFTTNGMCAKKNTAYRWREQAIIEWSWRVISIVACCHSVKLCAHVARAFRSQQNGAMTRTWRSCRVQPSHKERAIGVVRCKKEGMLLQPLRWRCVECVIHREQDVREEKHRMYVARTSNNRVIVACDLYCCLLPQCEALCTCRSSFPIASILRNMAERERDAGRLNENGYKQ